MSTTTPSKAARAAPPALQTLVERFDHDRFDLPGMRAIVRLLTTDGGSWDVVIDQKRARLASVDSGKVDATLAADSKTWDSIAEDVASGMEAFRRGRLQIRRNLHLGRGFLAATSARPSRATAFPRVQTARGRVFDARGRDRPADPDAARARRHEGVVPADGRGLAPSFRTIAVDLLGFGDSDKPLGASYGPDFQARGVGSCSTRSSSSGRTSSGTAWGGGWRSSWGSAIRSGRSAWCS